MELPDIIERIVAKIKSETFSNGDVLSLDIGEDISLEEEREIYLAVVEALHEMGHPYVKVRTKRKASA